MDLADITFRDDTRYTYAVGRVRALETKLLTRADFSRLLDAEDYAQALRSLMEMGYPVSEERADHEPVLVAEQHQALALLEQLSQDDRLADVFRRRYDFHNLKVLLKARHSRQEMDQAILDLGALPVEVISEAVIGDEPGRLPEPLSNAYRAAEEAFGQTGSPADLDVAVEREQYAYMARELAPLKSPFLKAWLEWEVDLLNIKSFLRLKWLGEELRGFDAVMLPGGSLSAGFFRPLREESLDTLGQAFQRTPYGKAAAEGISQLKAQKSFAPLERGCDDLMIALLRRSRETSFGVEPVVAFILLKEFEIKGIRAVMVGKLNGLPKDKIKERLPGAYI
jgi:V/A-type H+-transporting ATPase subunit C